LKRFCLFEVLAIVSVQCAVLAVYSVFPGRGIFRVQDLEKTPYQATHTGCSG
jgi:hypothetical protein